MPITLAIALYSTTWAYLIRSARGGNQPDKRILLGLLAIGLIFHGFSVYSHIVVPGGYQFGLYKIGSVFFFTANLLIMASTISKPLHNLFVVVLPLSIMSLLSTLFLDDGAHVMPPSTTIKVMSHIILSVLAYSTMIIATVQALVLAYQNHRIRHKHPSGLVKLLPPLMTMETLLFELLWVGEILLTLVIITGALHIYDMGEQHLHHKIIFTLIAWLIYAVLLCGRHFLGWRGNSAIKWALSGFGCLLVAYLGTKLVLNIILA